MQVNLLGVALLTELLETELLLSLLTELLGGFLLLPNGEDFSQWKRINILESHALIPTLLCVLDYTWFRLDIVFWAGILIGNFWGKSIFT